MNHKLDSRVAKLMERRGLGAPGVYLEAVPLKRSGYTPLWCGFSADVNFVRNVLALRDRVREMGIRKIVCDAEVQWGPSSAADSLGLYQNPTLVVDEHSFSFSDAALKSDEVVSSIDYNVDAFLDQLLNAPVSSAGVYENIYLGEDPQLMERWVREDADFERAAEQLSEQLLAGSVQIGTPGYQKVVQSLVEGLGWPNDCALQAQQALRSRSVVLLSARLQSGHDEDVQEGSAMQHPGLLRDVQRME